MPLKPFSLYDPFSGEFFHVSSALQKRILISDNPHLVEVDVEAESHVEELRSVSDPVEISEESFQLNTTLVDKIKVVKRDAFLLIVTEKVMGDVFSIYFHDTQNMKFFYAQDKISDVDSLISIFIK